MKKLTLAVCLLIGSNTLNAQSTSDIEKLFTSSTTLAEHFTGFMLYDADEKSLIYGHDEEKYFTPASNTKLYTMYATLSLLTDSIPALRYVERGDSLIFWGTGDPTFLNSLFDEHKAYDFLKSSDKRLFFGSGNYTGYPFGEGWSWDDYNYYYQPEISAFPIYGNVVHFTSTPTSDLAVSPYYFAPFVDNTLTESSRYFAIRRDYDANYFRHSNHPIPVQLDRFVPFKTSPQLTASLLADTLRKQVNLIHAPVIPADARIIFSHPLDTVIKAMMLPSDNFIAEHLLLVCASQWIGDRLDPDSIRRYIVEERLSDLPQKPEWHDGSGLSRLNLFTPATTVGLLLKLRELVPDETRLRNMFPEGGVSGTLKTAFKTDNGVPFVWAKTGSLSNNHNQSGYLLTRKGKLLVYSFMNNNFIVPTQEVRREMVRIITTIREKY